MTHSAEIAAHCRTCSCGTVEYGVTFLNGEKAGELIGPLPTESICYWNRNTRISTGVRLIMRVRPETEWRRATDNEVDHWNREVMAPHVLGTARQTRPIPPGGSDV